MWAVEHFRMVDHTLLQWVSTLKEMSDRVSRWKERFASYQYQVLHTPGRSNMVANWLSWAVEEDKMPHNTLDDDWAMKSRQERERSSSHGKV